MVSGLKTKAIAGLGKQSAFKTGVACSQFLDLVNESVKASTALMAAGTRSGTAADDFIGLGAITLAGLIEDRVRYLQTTDPAHVLLEQLFGKAVGHWYRRVPLTGSATSWVGLRTAATIGVELADKPAVLGTTPPTAGITVRRWLKRVLTPAGETNGVWIEIQTDAAGAPSGTAVTNGISIAKATASITADSGGAEYEFTFAVQPTLAASTQYHIVLKGDYTPSATAYVAELVETVASGGLYEQKNVAYAADATKNGVGRGLTTSWTDTYLMAESIEGFFATFAVDKQTAVHELIGVKVKQGTLTSTPAAGLVSKFDVAGYDEKASGQTNTPAMLAGLKNVRSRALMKDLTLWVADQTVALSSAGAMTVDSLIFTLARPLDAPQVSGQRQILEPVENGVRKVALALKLPRYAAETWRTWQNAGTQLQIRAQWALGASYVTLWLPNCVIDGAVAIETSDAAAYSQDVTVQCFGNPGTNLFMPIQLEAELNYLAA